MRNNNISLRKRLGLELHRKLKDRLTVQHQLSYLFWECTLRCNLACKHCGSDCRQSAEQKDMPLGDFLKVIDRITPHVDPHRTMIVLTGGEPLLREDLETCGHELYQREYPWGMVSNGLELTPRRIDRLMDAGMRALTVSLDGPEPVHNALRGNGESFRQAYRAIRYLADKNADLAYDVVTCVTPASFDQLEEMKELLIAAGLKRWRIFTVFPIGRATRYADDLQLDPVRFRGLFEFIKATRQEGHIDLSYGCEGFLGNYETEVRDDFFFCRAGVNVGSVLADGSISACPNLRANFVQGNIYRDDFMEVWNNRYLPFRDRSWTKQGECAGCKHHRYCQGNGMHLRDESGNLLFCHLKRIETGEEES